MSWVSARAEENEKIEFAATGWTVVGPWYLATMSSYGWTNDSTYGVAGACDNTASFEDSLRAIVDVARGGDIETSASQLRDAVQTRALLAATLPSWVNLDEVNWRELVSQWAQEE